MKLESDTGNHNSHDALEIPWPLDGGREAEIGGRNSQKLRYF